MEKKYSLAEIESIVRNGGVSKGDDQNIKAFVVFNKVNPENGNAKFSALLNGSPREISASIAVMMEDSDVVRDIIYRAVKGYEKLTDMKGSMKQVKDTVDKLIKELDKLAGMKPNANKPKAKRKR